MFARLRHGLLNVLRVEVLPSDDDHILDASTHEQPADVFLVKVLKDPDFNTLE